MWRFISAVVSLTLISQSAFAFSHGYIENTAFPTIAGLNFRINARQLAITSGGTISAWPDLSGSGNNLTGGSSPLYYSGTALDTFPLSSFRGDTITQSTYVVNKQAWSVLYVLSLSDIEQAHYLMNIGALGLVPEVVNGQLKVFSGLTTTFRPATGRRIAILITFGASAVKVYVDASTNVQSFSPFGAGSTSGGFTIGDSSGFLYANVYEVAAWSAELSLANAQSLLDSWAPSVYGTGASAAPSGHVVFDGDSITQGIGSTINQNWPMKLNPSNGWVGHDFAITGQTWANLITRQADTNFFASGANWLFIFCGTNDVAGGQTGAQMEANFQTYLNAAVAAGFSKSKIVVFTISAANQGAGGTARTDFNAWLRANYTTYAGFIVDLAHDPNLGASDVTGGHLNGAFWVDGAHYNDAGYTLFAALVRSVIGTVPF